jgi:hypothetical protein
MKKEVLLIYRMILKMLGIGGWTTNFGAASICHCFAACCSLQRGMQQRYTVLDILYLSIDIHFNLLHVEFEYGLSISVLKNKATCYKNYQL